jgi:hypothetical protein
MNRILIASLALLGACATTRPPGSPPETEISIIDHNGTAVSGEVAIQGLTLKARDNCQQVGESCAVAVPPGVYLLKFRKQRGGRVSSSLTRGGTGAKGGGCLLSRVKVEPGKPIKCKSNGGYDRCRGSRMHTMNCGESIAQPWIPKDGEPTDLTNPDDDEDDAPVSTQGPDTAPGGVQK